MNNTLKASCIAAFGVFAPIHAILLVAGILIFADLITGVWAAKVRGEKITSAAFRRTVTKMFIYHGVLITGFLLEVYLLESMVPVAKLAGAAIGVTEFLSILENASRILGEDLFKKLRRALGSENDHNYTKTSKTDKDLTE
jgi:phage-related holin